MDYSQEYRFVWKLRKYLFLLATLVISATYVAGLNPPGGLFVFVDPEFLDRAGDPVLASTHSIRYAAFFYCNAAAFLASLVIVMVLLDQRIVGNRVGLTVLWSAMLLDLVALMGAFTAGSCRDLPSSVYVPAAFAVLLAYVAIHLKVAASPGGGVDAEEIAGLNGRWKLPLLLATFATPLTYGAGLSPPGGFMYERGPDDGFRVGDPVLLRNYYHRYVFFFFCNATCFVSSLVIVTLLLSRSLSGRVAKSYALQACVLAELLGLMGAYAAGSSRSFQPTLYSISVAGALLLYIAFVGIFSMNTIKKWLARRRNLEQESRYEEHHCVPNEGNGSDVHIVVESRSLLLLLAALTAKVTYQEGLNPPLGYWRDEDTKMHPSFLRRDEDTRVYQTGHPSFLDLFPNRYNAFFHCNTTAFVASLVVIVILQRKQLLISGGTNTMRLQVLQAAIILSLFGLISAYAAGSCHSMYTTIYNLALAVANVMAFIILGIGSKRTLLVEGTVYKVLKKLHLLDEDDHDGQGQSKREEEDGLKKKRKSLLQLAILVATATYITGLSSSGGFGDKLQKSIYGFSSRKHLTVSVAEDPSRYLVFFYCNAAEFMASVGVILLLVNRRLQRQSIRSNVLQACIMIGFMALRTAYALGSTKKVRTSIYVYGLAAAVIIYLAVQVGSARCFGRRPTVTRLPLPVWLRQLVEPLSLRPDVHNTSVQLQYTDKYIKHKYLMLVAVLTASMSYQAGLAPPGSTWVDDRRSDHIHRAGDPILRDVNFQRYQAFFYCNATSFAASIVLIVLLLQRTVSPRGAPLRAMHAAMVLGLASLLGSYAAGTCWLREQLLAYATTLVAAVVVYVTLHLLLWRGNNTATSTTTSPASSDQPSGSVVTLTQV